MVTEKPFSFTRRQLILISVVGGFVLLLIFGLGVRAGEKRVFRKQIMPQTQSTPTPASPSPTTIPTLPPTLIPSLLPESPTSTPTFTPSSNTSGRSRTGEREQYSVPVTCTKDTNCIVCYVEGSVCTAGDCINGICVWPTLPPSEPRRK